MKHILFGSLIAGGFLILSPTPADAALVNIARDGAVTWNVLAMESEALEGRSAIEVKRVADVSSPSPDATLFLEQESGKLTLTVDEGSHRRVAELEGAGHEIVEIEEKLKPRRITISSGEGTFLITQGAITAETELPIRINATNQELSVSSPSGYRFIAVLPNDAYMSAVNANLITASSENVGLSENPGGELVYTVKGEKLLSLFDLISFSVPVTVQISATNGRMVATEEPEWYRVLGFLFV